MLTSDISQHQNSRAREPLTFAPFPSEDTSLNQDKANKFTVSCFILISEQTHDTKFVPDSHFISDELLMVNYQHSQSRCFALSVAISCRKYWHRHSLLQDI